ncbi:hypothetical protein RUM43_000283 [Polyplax serrata]|uniref:Uncharacterized protein n=1 Tax=Polyplax serrata TaxID=468196 RepID=A0AAN8XMX2_POLSC
MLRECSLRRMVVPELRDEATAGTHGAANISKPSGTTKKSNLASSVLRKALKELPPQLTRFQVTLDNPNRIFFAGDELKGNVEIDLSENLPIQGEPDFTVLYVSINPLWTVGVRR